jgi:hypothetical protein
MLRKNTLNFLSRKDTFKFSLRKDTFIFWKSNSSENVNVSVRSLSKEEAAEDISSFKDEDSYIYIAVTLTDKQLKLVTDEQSGKIKEKELLEKFNPFSPQIEKYTKEIKSFKIQKQLFAQGLFFRDSKKIGGQKNQSLLKLALAQNEMFDAALIKQELFSFLKPVHPCFKPKISSPFISSPVPFFMESNPLYTPTFYQPNEPRRKRAQSEMLPGRLPGYHPMDR